MNIIEKEFFSSPLSDSESLIFGIAENYAESIQKEMEIFAKNYSLVSEEKAREHFFSILHDFRIFGAFHDLSMLHPIEFIKRYETFITEDNIIDVYFSLNHYDTALEFIKLKKEELRACFKKYYIAFYELETSENCPISEFEYQMIISHYFKEESNKRNRVYSVVGCYKESSLKILLYRYFKEDVAFVHYNEEKNAIPLYGLYSNLDWKSLEEILADFYKLGEYEKVQAILEVALLNETSFVSNFTNIFPFNCYGFYGYIFLEYIKKINFDFSQTFYQEISLLKEQEKFIISNIKPSSIPSIEVLSNDFFANLKYLKKIPKKELQTHPLYVNLLDIYLSFCRSFYPFNVEEYLFIFKRLFNRLIEGNSLVELLQIRSLDTLFHFFKTNEIVHFKSNLEIPLATIKSLNAKQYFELKELLIKFTDREDEINDFSLQKYDDFSLENSVALDTIYLIYLFGYENCKKLLKLGVSGNSLIHLSKLNYKDEEEKDIFISVILRDCNTFIENEEDINYIFKIFRYLKEEKYPSITMKKIIKRKKSFEYALLPNVSVIKNNLLLLDLVSKGSPIDNKIEGIKLYNEYRLREKSSIPDIKGAYQNLEYETVSMHSPEIISNGIGKFLYPNNNVGSSCLTPAGKAATCLFHGAINPHGRFFKVTLHGKIVAYSWVWRAGDVLCFDNIEITAEALKIADYENVIMNLYLAATSSFIEVSEKEEKKPLKVVVCGKNKLDMLNKPFLQLKKVVDYNMDNFKPNQSDDLYLDDSKEEQYVLYGDFSTRINTTDTQHFYLYKPKSAICFDNFPDYQLQKLMNSIYFDYCLYTNKKYSPLPNKYVKGIIGEDWMIGYMEDGHYDLFYRTINKSISNSIEECLSINFESLIKKPLIITHQYEGLDYLLKQENYSINSRDLKDYLNSVREKVTSITPEDYYHTPCTIKNFGYIIYDGAITSSSFGKHVGGKGSNGAHFICIASLASSLFKTLSSNEGFIIDQNLCAFPTEVNIYETKFSSNFCDSRYPFRLSGGEGELQVLDCIELSKVKGILVNKISENNLARILYILDKKEVDIPLVLNNEEFYKLDKKELKRLIKLK